MKRIPLLANLVLAAFTLLGAAYCTFPWCDELVLADAPANWALHGVLEGRVWPCTYNFLYPALLSVWFKIFGVSHTTTCSLSVLAAFLTVQACLHIASRRRLISGGLAEMSLVCLFWGGMTLSRIITDGRLDALTMLFTVLFADALIPDANREENRRSLILTAAWAALLMLTSVYMLPVLFLLGIALLATFRSQDRKIVFHKGLASAITFAASYAFMLIWYFLHGETIRFLGFYLYFNTITGFKAEPMPTRILHAYCHNIEALVLMALAFIAAIALRKRLSQASVLALAFSLSIPLLMTIGGRYEAYYSWAFYLPVTIAILSLVSKAERRTIPLSICVLSGVTMFLQHQISQYRGSAPDREKAALGAAFVESHRDLFTNGAEVVVGEGIEGGQQEFFYPLLRSGARPWFRGYDTLNGPSDREKFKIGLGFLIKDPIQQDKVLESALRYQKCMPTLPETGYMIFTSEENRQRIEPLVEKLGRRIIPISRQPFILTKLN